MASKPSNDMQDQESVFLSDADVAKLTGSDQPATQIRWLTTRRIQFYINNEERPVVPRDVIASASPPVAGLASPGMFLDKQELVDYTGCRRRKEQIAELKRRRVKYEINKRDEVLVLRGHIEHRMGAGTPPVWEPDFSRYH